MMPTRFSSKWFRYGGAIAAVALATAARLALDPVLGNSRRLVTYLAAVMLTAWAFGSGPTLLSVFLSLVAAVYLFFEPRYSFTLSSGDQVGLLIFMVFGLIAAFFSEQLRRARERGEWRQRQQESDRARLESERRFKQLADAMPQMVWTIGQDGGVDYYNERWYEYTGMPRGPRGEESWVPALHPDDVERCKAAWQEAVASERPFQLEYRVKDGRTGLYRWHLGRAVPARDAAGRITQWFGTSTDIDDQKGVEEKLRHAHDDLEQRVSQRTAELTSANRNLSREIEERRRVEERMRHLAAELAGAEDTERRRLATDLHDSIGQSLSLLKLNLEPLARQAAHDPVLARAFATVLELVDNIIKQTRTLMFELYPSMLHDLGLTPTLSWYGEQLSSQAQVTVTEIGAAQTVPLPVASYLFRAAKELLGNALRHGRAREIIVALHWRREWLKIVIDDDGCGFDPEQVLSPQTQRGLGLAGIKERLSSLSGTMFIESDPGQGTRIALEVPLAR
jgi:PAS domain S-box-containing protein